MARCLSFLYCPLVLSLMSLYINHNHKFIIGYEIQEIELSGESNSRRQMNQWVVPFCEICGLVANKEFQEDLKPKLLLQQYVNRSEKLPKQRRSRQTDSS